jgi:predicted oxidoreductase
MALSPVIAGTMKWGVWGAKFNTKQYSDIIAAALDAGVTSFDHADIYGHYTTEEEFGRALATLSPSLRSQMQLITKCGIKMVTPNRPQHTIKHYDTGKQHILQSVETSLKNFGTDYIDVLLLHRPSPLLHPDEVAETFTQLQGQGKVRAFGVSNFTASQMMLLHQRFPLAYNQLEISVTHLAPFIDGTLDYCLANNIHPMAWAPLGGGNIFLAENERHLRITAVAGLLAEKYQAGADQILLAWLLQHPVGILPVLGTTKAHRIQAALAARTIHLSNEEWFMLWRASTGAEVA